MLITRRKPSAYRSVVLPPFFNAWYSLERQDVLGPIIYNPHPSEILLDSSVFSMDRLPLVREILLNFSPILLNPVRSELEDVKKNPTLAPLRDLLFPDGTLHPRFRNDDHGVLQTYPRFAMRYVNLLRWRREAIKFAIGWTVQETGRVPVGKARAKLIQKLASKGLAGETIQLANKEWRPERSADEVLAVFAVLSPIITGRDCFLYTADRDIFDQVVRMSHMLFDDYGAYLMARDFHNDESRYSHRHPYVSPLFVGDAVAVGRSAHPDYLLPPPKLVKTCATVVVDVARLRFFTWISARNMEAAISFQDQDPLGRKGDLAEGKSIIFTLPRDESNASCQAMHHFGIGTPALLKLTSDDTGPIPAFDFFRATVAWVEKPARKSRIVSPFADHQDRLLRRVDAATRRH